MILLGLPGMNLLLRPGILVDLGWITALLGVCGTICSAYIYLVPARPAWNMIHTPLDFLITTALLGSLLPGILELASNRLATLACAHGFCLPANNVIPSIEIFLIAASLWFLNLIVRRVRLGYSRLFEHRASAALLGAEAMQVVFYSSFALMAITALFTYVGFSLVACLTAFAAVSMARYLFFVSVVPLNMALTFVRGGSH